MPNRHSWPLLRWWWPTPSPAPSALTIEKDTLGFDHEGAPITLRDIWPADEEIDEIVQASVKPEQFRQIYIPMFEKTEEGARATSPLYDWRAQSTYADGHLLGRDDGG